MDAHLRPGRLQRKSLRPFQNYDGWSGKHILQAQRFKIVKALDAIQIGVINLGSFSVNMDKREGGTRDFVFAGGSQPCDDSLRQRRFSAPEIACKQNKHWRSKPF